MKLGMALKTEITYQKSVKNDLWSKFLIRSDEYMQALDLTDDDLDDLESLVERPAGISIPNLQTMISKENLAKFTVDGMAFALCVRHVCGGPYGGGWLRCLMVAGVDDNLNEIHGSGTTFITLLPEGWHQKVVNHLKTMEV